MTKLHTLDSPISATGAMRFTKKLALPCAALLAVAMGGCGRVEIGSYDTAGAWRQPERAPLEAAPKTAAQPESHDRFEVVEEQGFVDAAHAPLSTFSVDVNTASYAYARSLLKAGMKPAPASVRLEEFLNNFDYRYPEPVAGAPVGINIELSDCPWAAGHKLARVGLQARKIAENERPGSNLVLLVDTSGSMSDENRLPLVKSSFIRLLDKLDERDRVGIVTYAGSSGIAAEPTVCDAAGKKKLKAILKSLGARGSTNGADGLRDAYRLAKKNLLAEGVNRVVLATDGDFNVGVADTSELVELAKREAGGNIYLTVLGFGTGNLNADLMKNLSVKANGNHYFIDTSREADRVLSAKLAGTLVPVARDVKIQVDFNPARVVSYRLIGYDTRRLANEDFNDDKKDAGEMGSGQSVTALYELTPTGAGARAAVDDSRYMTTAPKGDKRDWFTVKVRHQPVAGGASSLIEKAFDGEAKAIAQSGGGQRLAAAVAEFGLVLRESKFKGAASSSHALSLAEEIPDDDEDREELVDLIAKAIKLSKAD